LPRWCTRVDHVSLILDQLFEFLLIPTKPADTFKRVLGWLEASDEEGRKMVFHVSSVGLDP
jgi:hypothetical protein